MDFVKALCTRCNGELTVDPAEDAVICTHCGKPFVTEKGIKAYEEMIAQNNPDAFSDYYTIRLTRPHDSIISNSITFILVDGRPRPLADDAFTTLRRNEKCFEIPVFITDNEGTEAEGVLTGIADGNDFGITWVAIRSHPQLGQFYSDNKTVRFVERPGATSNW